MELKWSLRRIALSILLSLFLAYIGVAQSAPSSNEPVVEVLHVSCLTPGCSDTTAWRAYVNGTVLYEANQLNRTKPGPPRRVLVKVETKLEPDELTQLLGWAEKPDFLNALPEYKTAKVIDAGSFFKIIYRKEKFERRVTVYNYLVANDVEKAKLPLAVVKIIEFSRQVPEIYR